VVYMSIECSSDAKVGKVILDRSVQFVVEQKGIAKTLH
jgi:hypothetical protein